MTKQDSEKMFNLIGKELKKGQPIGFIVTKLTSRYGLSVIQAENAVNTWQEAEEIGIEELEAAEIVFDRVA